ncbi:POXA3b laccase small subunit [Mycena rebaudengoi]|nr:POXA3b laccase small subunit [Mycena rebaudengoi]
MQFEHRSCRVGRSPRAHKMFVLSRLFTLALVSVACASTLQIRQTTNTNAAINAIVDTVDSNLRHTGPTILQLQANHTLNSNTLGAQMTSIGNTFSRARTSLAATPISSGSTTVKPTNDDISITYADAIQLLAASLSGIQGTGAVPNFATLVATLDPIVAATTRQLNITSPNSIALVTLEMRDARQFFTAEGFTQTLAALGF